MALKWLLHSVCTYAFGSSMGGGNRQSSQILRYPNEEHTDASFKSLKESNEGLKQREICIGKCPTGFQMPLHYPRYKKVDYENMEEWKVDMLLREYGLSFNGSLDEKRAFAIGAFIWPDQI